MHKFRQIVIKSKAKLKIFKQIRTYKIFAIFESFQVKVFKTYQQILCQH